MELAVAMPRSLWQWTAMMALSTLGTLFIRLSMIAPKISGVVYPTVSGMLMVLAPFLMAVSTTRQRNSGSVRPASSAENCTSSHLLRASFTLWVMRARISSGVRRSFFSRWMVEVPMKVWMRGRSAGLTALAQVRMSFSTARARPQMTGPLISRAMVSTDSKSPSDEMGKPASITSTCKVASCRAMRIFC